MVSGMQTLTLRFRQLMQANDLAVGFLVFLRRRSIDGDFPATAAEAPSGR